MVKYEKITLFDEFLVLLGPIISRLFTCSNEEKINKNNKTLKSYLYGNNVIKLFCLVIDEERQGFAIISGQSYICG
jgi:hypothetical protein